MTRDITGVALIRGVVEGVGALGLFVLWLEGFDSSEETARTVALASIIVAELMEAHGSRSLYRTIVEIGAFKNLYIWGATLISLGMTLLVIYVAPLQDAFGVIGLGVGEWAAVTGVAAFRLAVIEGMKLGPWRLGLRER